MKIIKNLEEILFKNLFILDNILQNRNKTIWILNEPSKEVSSYNELNNFIKLGWIKLFKPKD